MKTAFPALIQQHNIKSLRSGDKEARLTLEYSATDDKVIDKINRLHRADGTIMVVLMTLDEAGAG